MAFETDEALNRIASGIRALGLGDAATSMGAIEGHAVMLKESLNLIADAIDHVAESIEAFTLPPRRTWINAEDGLVALDTILRISIYDEGSKRGRVVAYGKGEFEIDLYEGTMQHVKNAYLSIWRQINEQCAIITPSNEG